SPTQLVILLNQIFSAFDQLTEQFGLEKIKTIGDAYMVAGGLPMPRPDHAEAIADMALAMRREIARLSQTLNHPLSIRIGINSGPVVAGVIGTKKFIYDLWGDTVNIASRMESQGRASGIQIAPATYTHLQGKYTFESRGPIEVKGRGQIETYWLTGKVEI
ncbi:MAG: adenylate/guanylate cyclase domain-containing protein, partial [Pseudanabaenales cyanobacterium]|nr:adenylate/guanylate cyclase domain-containing protein [Pseudanabaenales cyanobacterium]